MRRRWHRREKAPSELDITPFMNLMVILVPFLLITAVFSRVTILDLYLPPESAAAVDKPRLNLEVVIRDAGLEVADGRGLIRHLPNTDIGPDVAALTDLLKAVKLRFPETVDATLLLEPEVEYDTLVQVMDAVRMTPGQEQGKTVWYELFPNISLGDAPLEGRAS